MALTWTMTLKDAMSGAANKAARAVDKLTGGLQRADRASSKSLGSKSFDGVASSAQRAGKAVDQLHTKMAKTGKGGAGGAMGGAAMQAGGKGGGLGAGLGAIAGPGLLVGALAAVYGGALAGTFELGSLISDASKFKSSTMFALEQITKSKQGAQEAFDTASKTANAVGADFRTSMSAMNSLMAQGFDTKFADEMIRAMADLKTINPAANMEGITRAMSQIKTTGRLQGDELMQLAEAGLNVDKVYQQIGKSMGLVDGKLSKKGQKQSIGEQVRALQEAGAINSDTAINAIMASIKDQVGGKNFGELAASKASSSLEGALVKANNLKESFLSSVKIDWSPATRALDRVAAVLNSPAGERFSAKLSAGFGRLLGVLDGISDKDMAAFLENAGDAFTAFTKQMVIWGERAIWVGEKAAWLAGKFKSLNGQHTIFDFMSLDNMWISLKEKFNSINFDGLGASAIAAIDGIGPAISESAMGLGSSIVDGITAGISAGAGAIADAATTAAQGALASAKSFLGIKSPSKLFRDQVGGQIARGMALGIEGGTPQVRDASAGMGSAAFRGGQELRGEIRNSSVRNSSATANLYQQGGDDAEAANTIAIRALADQLRGMNAAAA